MVVEPRSRSAPPGGALPSGPSSLGRTAAWLSKQVERALADEDLSLPQYRILGMLAEGASMPSALADRLAVRRPTVTAVVDGLVARGLVERSPADDDRLSVTHTLTGKGKRLLAKADAAADRRLVAIAQSLDDTGATRRALEGLELWRSALRAHFVAQLQRSPR